MPQIIAFVIFLTATWFGVGRSPRAPGTVGSLAALPFGAALMWAVGGWGLAAATAGLFLLGTWAAHHYAARLGRDDPGEIVVDEVVGQWLPLCVLPVEPVAYALAFVSFRFFDIVKPWPIGVADRRLKGGLGIMIDDVLAALAAAIVCLAVYAPLARTLLTGE